MLSSHKYFTLVGIEPTATASGEKTDPAPFGRQYYKYDLPKSVCMFVTRSCHNF